MGALLRPPPHLIPFGLRAMKTVASARGEFKIGARRFLEAAQRVLLGVEVDLDALDPIEPAEFALRFDAPLALKQQFVRAMCVLTLVDGSPDERVTAAVRRFAREVAIEEPALRALELLAEGHVLLGTLDYLRRSNLRGMLEGELAKGILPAARAVLGVRGLVENPLIAEPFLALEDLPVGTLGRALFDHYRSNGFAFPGERYGFPESGIYHDLTHVLAGYATNPYGELQIGAFTAGFRKKDPFFVALLPLLLFVAGVNVTPIPHDFIEDMWLEPDVAESYLRAFDRGAKVRVDLSDGWDFWPLLARDLEHVRTELGIAGGVSGSFENDGRST